MIFGRRSDYIKFDEVIDILVKERSEHHYASTSSIEKRCAITECIEKIKLYQIHKYPRRYMFKTMVFNDEAKSLLRSDGQ